MSYDIGSKLLQKVELCLFLLTLQLLQFDVWHKLELVGIEILKSPMGSPNVDDIDAKNSLKGCN